MVEEAKEKKIRLKRLKKNLKQINHKNSRERLTDAAKGLPESTKNEHFFPSYFWLKVVLFFSYTSGLVCMFEKENNED